MADSTRPPSDGTATSSTAVFDDGADIRECLDRANHLKLEANALFKAGKWSEAVVSYRTALGQLPPRRQSAIPAQDHPSAGGTAVDHVHDHPSDIIASDSALPEPGDGVDLECSKARAVINANIGACLLKLDDHKGVVDVCTQALNDDPHYVKALQRRIAANEKLDTWSSLGRAQEDYKLLLDLLPEGSPEVVRTRKALQLLEPRVQAAQKRETTEMLDKLKGLGNSILGNFGLSTDNFKFEPNGQGGYSMNFVR
ncbi:hypothetical protein F5I97DRAFT_1584674 [Phlebopus sp. FC_14]|nr:hypothetical protein F5I97DRAFT_1584674 [Phlebopus sp. FC_14]